MNRFVPALILIVAFFAIAKLDGKMAWSTPLPTLQEMERQVRFDFERLGNVFQFESPSMSRFSITYLTIKEVRQDALLLQGMNLQSIPNDRP